MYQITNVLYVGGILKVIKKKANRELLNIANDLCKLVMKDGNDIEKYTGEQFKTFKILENGQVALPPRMLLDGLKGKDIIDLILLYCYWKASHNNNDYDEMNDHDQMKSMVENSKEKYGVEIDLEDIFYNSLGLEDD